MLTSWEDYFSVFSHIYPSSFPPQFDIWFKKQSEWVCVCVCVSVLVWVCVWESMCVWVCSCGITSRRKQRRMQLDLKSFNLMPISFFHGQIQTLFCPVFSTRQLFLRMTEWQGSLLWYIKACISINSRSVLAKDCLMLLQSYLILFKGLMGRDIKVENFKVDKKWRHLGRQKCLIHER